ncbi:hypothetical protein ACP70R_021252 [Stipagrostis hirtigluma subsp. patula]
MAPIDPAAGDIDGPLSASAIVGAVETGHHLLHIDGYSHTKELPNGKFIKSCPFSAGGRSWRIAYYPNGDDSDSAEFISVFLNYAGSVAEPVKARARFALLDLVGKPVPTHIRTTKFHSGHLKGDRFTIKCDVIVAKELRAEERKPTSLLVVVPPSDLHRHFGDLLADEEGKDVTFQVAGETFKAHRCVLAARSKVLKAQVFGKMKESTTGAVIRVDDMDAQVFRSLLHFVYTDALPDCPDMNELEEAAMAQHLLVAADRYNLERLKLICEDRLCGHVTPRGRRLATAGT